MSAPPFPRWVFCRASNLSAGWRASGAASNSRLAVSTVLRGDKGDPVFVYCTFIMKLHCVFVVETCILYSHVESELGESS